MTAAKRKMQPIAAVPQPENGATKGDVIPLSPQTVGQSRGNVDFQTTDVLPDTREASGHTPTVALGMGAAPSPVSDTTGGQMDAEPHLACAAGNEEDGGRTRTDTHASGAPASLLTIYADTYESVQKLRLAQMNRLRCWLRDTLPRAQWGETDFSDEALNDRVLYERLPNDQRVFVDEIRAFERSAERYLTREITRHRLWPWLSSVRGVGPVLGGRLMARIDLARFPGPAHLWSYCGLDGPDWKRKTEDGKLTYNRKIGTLCWNIGRSFVITGGPYRRVYDERKEYERNRPWCGRCHPKGNTDKREHCPDGHMNSKAQRYAVKRFLQDLWVQGNA